eukprot:2447757-Pleurochrysis_carterae.AAC.1
MRTKRAACNVLEQRCGFRAEASRSATAAQNCRLGVTSRARGSAVRADPEIGRRRARVVRCGCTCHVAAASLA